MVENININDVDDKTCTNCTGKIILTRSGYTCSNCGLVYESQYCNENYFISGKQGYDIKLGKQFVGLGKQLDNVSNLGSYIDYYKSGFFYDSNNSPLKPEKQKLFYRLKFTRDFRTRLDNNETYHRIIKILKKISNYLSLLPDIRKRAMYFYNKIIKKATASNQEIPNHVSLIASCLFLASREYSSQAPITIQELCNSFKDFGHRVNCKMIIRDMLRFKKYVNIKRTNHDSKDYLERLINKLYHNEEFNDRFVTKEIFMDVKTYIHQLKLNSCKILENISKGVRSCRNPFILAGASIYGADVLLAKKNKTKRVLTQKILANATGIAEYSIRDHYCSVIKPSMNEMVVD
ncbi:MAG: hypothetical protein ACFFCS_15650 [Candidatus Hodarchaeota archaeon]